MNLRCFECPSESIEWVGHREIVRCQACNNVWEPNDPQGYTNIVESISIPRECLPEKGNAFEPYLLTRFGRVPRTRFERALK